MTATAALACHRPHILIVDDERHNRQLLEVMLQPEGFHLSTAASGEEALAMVAQDPPDLILLDIMMPGLDGYQVASRLKGDPATKDIPVIVVTALTDPRAKMLGLGAGAEEYISKPVNRAELVVRVRNLSRLKSSSDAKHAQALDGEVSSRTAALVTRAKTLEDQAIILAEQAALLDLAQDAIVVRDMQGRILFWNRGAEVMYGWLSAEALGRSAADLLRPGIAEPTEIEVELLLKGQWEGETIHCNRDGTPLIVASRWALQRSEDGTPIRILMIANDITGRKRADAERFLLTERLSLATAVAKVGVWEWDLASNTLTWDATMFDMYGLPPTVPMPYDRWSAAVRPEDLSGIDAALRKVIDEKGQGSAEYRIVRPDGSMRHVSAVQRVVLDERAQVSRLIGVAMDVTERKLVEEALERLRQDQLRFKDDFLSHVSHELRSPLTAIKQFTSILLGGIAGKLNEEQRTYQEIVLKNIHQLQSMIDDLLEVTQLETGKLTVELESVSVATAVTDAFNTLRGTASATGISLSCDVPQDLPSVYADQTRLRQILIILLDNAIKFTPAGGAMTILARPSTHDPRLLLIEVSDTGCGIGAEVAERIFERLYQVSERIEASRKGLGLGLYICRELVTRQGGSLWVKSESQRGTTSSFTLPVFSLDTSIAFLLEGDKWPAESVALVAVETRASGAWPTNPSREAWPQEARGLLQSCLSPDLDVLLPNMSFDTQRECFFVAAFADAVGASGLVNRIEGHFERHFQLKRLGLALSVSYTMMQPLPRESGGTTDAIVTQMAATLEEAIKTHTIPRTVHHG